MHVKVRNRVNVLFEQRVGRVWFAKNKFETFGWMRVQESKFTFGQHRQLVTQNKCGIKMARDLVFFYDSTIEQIRCKLWLASCNGNCLCQLNTFACFSNT